MAQNNMTQAYAQGFTAKCAEYGVDPKALYKVAASDYSNDAEFPDTGGTRAIGNNLLERLGQFNTLATGAGAGAALGSRRVNNALSRIGFRGIKGKGIGAIIGLSAGLGANMLGSMRGTLTKGRTGQDQIGYDKKLRWSNLFMPGHGAYNATKRKEREQITQWHG